MAGSILNDARLAILPTSCQISLKKLVCSNIYLKCPKNIDLSSVTYSGWNLYIYTDILSELTNLYGANVVPSPYIPVPFQRPCKKICTDVADSCLGLLGLIGLDQNCSTRYDYSFGALSSLYAAFPSLPKPYQYDASNNAAVCNAMNVSFAVASTKEPYLHALDPNGACYGITSELWVPPANLLDPSLASMQPPYVVQTMIEGQLADNFKALPAWLSKRCHLALRKYFCGSYMLAPSPQVVRQVFNDNGFSNNVLFGLTYAGYVRASLLSYEFFLPSYPHVSVCEEYVSACGDFVSLAGIAALVPNCSAQTGSIKDFPSANQTIQSLPLSLGPYHSTILFRTPPNSMASATTEAYTTSCPTGFVVPDKEDSRTTWVPGTGCAVGCSWPTWTEKEWGQLRLTVTVAAWVGLPMVLMLLLTWTVDKDRRKQYLVIIFGIFSSIATIMFCAASVMPIQATSCATNAVGYDQTDAVNFCTLQALLLLAAGVGTASSWAMLSVDLLLKVALGYRSTKSFKPFFLAFIVVLTGSVVVAASFYPYGYIQAFPFCFMALGNDVYTVYVPMAACTIIGLIAMLIVIYRIVQSIMRTQVHSQDADSLSSGGVAAVFNKFQMLKIPTLFLVAYLICVVAYESNRIVLYRTDHENKESANDFAKCVFQNYDGNSDSSWQSACGTHPSKRPSWPFSIFVMLALAGQSILISGIYLSNPSVWKYWISRLGLRGFKIGTRYGVSGLNSKVSEGGSVVERKRLSISKVSEGGSVVERLVRKVSVNERK